MGKKRIVVICPGRGSYTRETSGYLKNYGTPAKDQINFMDEKRNTVGLPTISELDSQSFKTKIHMKGEHASTLIYACSLADFVSIDQSKYEIVAITGNSMGWYLSLAFGGALKHEKAYSLIDTMGSMMKDTIIGGQIIYPITNDNWRVDEVKKENIINKVEKAGAYISIYLGGYLVIGGARKALDKLLKSLPQKDNYPFQLPYHAAYHTALLESVSEKAFTMLPEKNFQKPIIPLVDGRGYIWSPWATDSNDLWNYTLGDQVCKTYDFTMAINVAIKEFCPDRLVLLGPGNTLGGPIGQIIAGQNWQDISCKKNFTNRQKTDPFLISLGIPGQRNLICHSYEKQTAST